MGTRGPRSPGHPTSRENVGERAPQGSSAAKKAITPSPPCANWSECRSPATCDWLGRPEAATKVRRRKLALLVESEFKASDMILRVPAPRRRSEAQGHRRVPRHASAPLMREKGPVSRWAAPQGSAPPHRAGRHRAPAPTRWTGPSAPGVEWVGDITYIRTWVGFVYLATAAGCCYPRKSSATPWPRA